MDELDCALLEAWNRAGSKRTRRAERGVVSRPVRSWALVLRANDSRLLERTGGFLDARHRFWVELTGEAVRDLCAWVRMPWPGVPPDVAAGICGVNVKTIHAWEKKGIVVIDRYVKPWLRGKPPENPATTRPRNCGSRGKTASTRRGSHDWMARRADGQLARGPRGKVLVWTRTAIDPGGEVWSGPWGSLRERLNEKVPLEFSQVIRRGVKKLQRGASLAGWQCPSCGEWVAKVYLAISVRTIGGDAVPLEWDTPSRFVCRRCAGLIYESAERTSWGGNGKRVDVLDRFVRRISGGVLGLRDLELSSEDVRNASR